MMDVTCAGLTGRSGQGADQILFLSFVCVFVLFCFVGCVLGLRCCVWAFSSWTKRGLLFLAVRGLLIAVASLVAEHGVQVRGLHQLWHAGSVVVARGLQSAGSVVVEHRLSCSTACGIFPDQGLNPRPLHQQADSQPLRHQGSPQILFLDLSGSYKNDAL